MTRYYSLVEHPFTRMLLFSSEKGLCSAHFIPADQSEPDPADYCSGHPLLPDTRHHEALIQKLHLYFDGVPVAFDIPLDLAGTVFQKQVWQAIAEIPFGRTLTYGEIAARVGSPKGFRAVGAATGRNPVPVIIPCHRVMGASGALTGFSAPDGINLKRRLLRLEGIVL